MPDIGNLMTQMAVLIIGVTVGIIVLTWVIIFMIGRSRRKKAEHLAAHGVQGTATILGLEDTGMRVNDNPRVKVTLQIQLPNMAPYQLTKTMVLPMIRMSQVQVGATVGVMVDPTQPNNPDKVGLLLQ